jgi:hypothetical protein
MADRPRWQRIVTAVLKRVYTCLMLVILFVCVVIITLLLTRHH